MIKYFLPANLKEALEILNENDCYIIAGGTDLMVQKHYSSGLIPRFDKSVLFVNDLKELDYINLDKEGNVHIGASTKYYELEESNLIPQIYKDVISQIASPNIRNMATLVGNIANASPAGDSLVPLIINDAKVILSSVNGTREMLISDFIYGVRKIHRERNELITEVILLKQDLTYLYRKVGSRKAETITKVSALVAYKLENNILKDFRVAFGSVSIKIVRNKEIENKYIGKNIKDISASEIVNDYYPLVSPISDQRSTKEYRHKVAMNLLNKFLEQIKGGSDE